MIKFTVYTHDDSYEEAEEFAHDYAENAGHPEMAWAIEKFLEENPFYEVAWECEVDTESGEVTIAGASPSHSSDWRLVR